MLLAKEGFESVKGPCSMGTAGSDRQEGVCSRDEENSREVHQFLKPPPVVLNFAESLLTTQALEFLTAFFSFFYTAQIYLLIVVWLL
jgi:hypothetical protein